MEFPNNPDVGQMPFDKDAAIKRKLDKILEMIQRLQASQVALIATLKEVPASDGEMMLNAKRWSKFQAVLDKELKGFGLE